MRAVVAGNDVLDTPLPYTASRAPAGFTIPCQFRNERRSGHAGVRAHATAIHRPGRAIVSRPPSARLPATGGSPETALPRWKIRMST
ncbi:hypothetical protein [Pseudofulvimonas gallinarii]|uniref:hypothetical protein n=1 Tax=Pseudofulvimonas gallinarii TaxID=634155 RepID=UPI0035E5240E